jgi:hypothetical protein
MTGSMRNEYICFQRIHHPDRAAFEIEKWHYASPGHSNAEMLGKFL